MLKSLPLATTYQLRKLLHQNFDRLTSIVADGAGLKADPFSDLNAVLESLYLEDSAITATIVQLEQLVTLHQSLSRHKMRHRLEIRQVEQEIFWLLGFRFREIEQRGVILAIDDTPLNLKMLSKMLEQYGYEVYTEESARAALSIAPTLQPDLILLDVMMAELSGYEVCDRLKHNPVTRGIPVIFLSTITEAIDKVKAFDVGGMDYITKPFQLEELLARIEHQLNLRTLQKRLEAQNIRLQEEFQERQQTEALYRELFENAGYGIFQSTLEGRYLRVNVALAQLYGYDSPEALITAVNNISQQIYVNRERRAEFVAQLQFQQTLAEFESQVYRKDGSVIWIAETVRKVYDDSKNFLFYEGIVRELTGN